LIEAGEEQRLAQGARLVAAGHAAPVEQRRSESGDAVAPGGCIGVERQAEGLRESVLDGTRRGQLGFARREFEKGIVMRVVLCFDDAVLRS
jgi:hypothetical protein